MDNRFAALDERLSGIERRLAIVTWLAAVNVAMTLAVLGKLLHG